MNFIDVDSNQYNPNLSNIFALDDCFPIKHYKISDGNRPDGYINNSDWINNKHVLYDTKLFTVDDPKYEFENNNYFKGILYDPQATLLNAMVELENTQSLQILDHTKLDYTQIDNIQDCNIYTAHSRYGILSVKFSFGKTVLALALICAQKYPLNKSTIYPLLSVFSETEYDQKNRMNVNVRKIRNTRYNNFKPSSAYGFFPEVELDEDNIQLLPITMVAAASSIIIQWEENIKKFTNLKYFIIDDVHSLRNFDKMIKYSTSEENPLNSKKIKNIYDYDLILVKVGSVTGSYRAIGETNKRVTSIRPIFDAIRVILKEYKISRFIIDDFDVIKLTGNDFLINACFTWFISATRRQSGIKSMLCENSYFSAEEIIMANLEAPAITFTSDDVLSNVFNIRCDPDYIDQHINTTNVIFRKIVVKGNKTKLLQNLNIPSEIIEMINGDAIGLAAQALGLEVNSIGDLIQKIMGVHITDIKYAIKILDRIATIESNIGIELTSSTELTYSDELASATEAAESNTEINTIRKIITLTNDEDYKLFISGNKSYFDIKNKEIKINLLNENNIENIKRLKEKMTIQYEKNSIIMNRMRDNIREDHCQCCTLPFEDDEGAYILSNCCQIIICEGCITTNINGNKTFIKRCPNCSVELMYADGNKGLIKIGNSINLEDALSDHIFRENDKKLIESQPNNEIIESSNEEMNCTNMKIRALLHLIHTLAPITDSYCLSDNIVPQHISGLLVGRQDIPHTGEINKFLIFSLVAETTHLLAAELTSRNILYQILHGTVSQKNKILSQFEKTDNNILLVTATNDCAGMHMPFVSHIIFYHKILDSNIESQIAARGQRLGRTNNLEIISLLYQNE